MYWQRRELERCVSSAIWLRLFKGQTEYWYTDLCQFLVNTLVNCLSPDILYLQYLGFGQWLYHLKVWSCWFCGEMPVITDWRLGTNDYSFFSHQFMDIGFLVRYLPTSLSGGYLPVVYLPIFRFIRQITTDAIINKTRANINFQTRFKNSERYRYCGS